MRFLFLVHGDEQAERELTRAELRSIVEQHMAFADGLRDRGQHVLGEALAGSEHAFVVRPGDPPVVVDGPHAATKEAIGGFYVVDCDSREQAIELASRVPQGPGMFVEVLTVASI